MSHRSKSRQAATKAETSHDHAVREALAREIADIIAARGLTQVQAAGLLGTSQPKVSALVTGDVEGFSLDRLVRFLNRLGEDVHIVVLPKAEGSTTARTQVTRAMGSSLTLGWSHA